MNGKWILGQVWLPPGGAVTLHDVRQLAAIVRRESLAWSMIIAHELQRPIPFNTEIMVRYFYSEIMSRDFGYVIENHVPQQQPYKSIYDRLITTRPELKRAVHFYGYRVFGDTPIQLSLIEDMLILVYERV